ncbi:hypothetical protein BBJ28_00019224 [Nothophytophthora sp. Chile5]|nr:hypothetical protein BBJ28_00019224 [Nothophytophthora sp. Chile5]
MRKAALLSAALNSALSTSFDLKLGLRAGDTLFGERRERVFQQNDKVFDLWTSSSYTYHFDEGISLVDGVANLIHSSDSGPAPAGYPPAQSEGGGDGEVYDATLWAKILDDDTHMELEGEDAEQKPPYVASVGDTAAAALHFGSNQARGGLGSAFASLNREGYPASLGDDMKTEPGATPIFDHWGHYDPEMAGAMADVSPTIHAPPPSSSASAASTPSRTSYQPTIESSFMGSAGMSSLVSSHHPTFSAFSNRTHILSFEPQPDGTPFCKRAAAILHFLTMHLANTQKLCYAALSKPIIREDGILLVGTEIVPDHSSTKSQVKNRIFVTNFLRSNQSSQAPSHILVEEVRPLTKQSGLSCSWHGLTR